VEIVLGIYDFLHLLRSARVAFSCADRAFNIPAFLDLGYSISLARVDHRDFNGSNVDGSDYTFQET
jgi:hypothetical protein